MKKSEYFKGLDHYSRRDAKVALCHFLMKQEGWQVFGYHADQSDSMTDYYNPASWGGVATFGEYTLVVDCRSAADAKPIYKETRVTAPCEHCLETGEEPGSEWTLEKARRDPKGYNAYKDKRNGQGVTLFNDVVSPLHFKDGGAEKCSKCHGTCEVFVRNDREEIGQYPGHKANPAHRGWHLEQNGNIIVSGQSIAKMYEGYWDGVWSEKEEAVQQACQEFLTELRIGMELEQRSEANKVALGMNDSPVSLTHGAVELVDYSEKAIAVFGDTKPLKDQLKAERGRFNAHLTHPTTKAKTPGWIFSKKQRPNVERLIQSL